MHITLARHLNQLCVEIGARPLGSPANQRAADYIRDTFRSLGWEVEEQEYACTGWDCAAASLTIAEEQLPVEANAFSPGCEVAAPLLPLATLDELAAADLNGKIALFYGELAGAPLSPKSWFLKGERDDAILGLLEAKRPAALIAPPPPTPQYEQLTCDWELDIPAATVPMAILARLLRHPGPARLRLECAKRPATARNLVARRHAAHMTSSRPEKIVLMAHFDTRIATPGALDNAAGAAALLELAASLGDQPRPYGLELIAFNGEEYLPMGDDEYVRRAGEASFGEIRLAINMDGIGQAGGDNTITHFNAAPELTARLEEIVRRSPAIRWVEPWPESNHSTFAFRGVPALAFSSTGAAEVAHYPTDTVEMVSIEKLAEVVEIVREIVAS